MMSVVTSVTGPSRMRSSIQKWNLVAFESVVVDDLNARFCSLSFVDLLDRSFTHDLGLKISVGHRDLAFG